MQITLLVKMNDEQTPYIREIKRVHKWHMSGGLLSVSLLNGDKVYIIKDYIVSIDESEEVYNGI